MEVYKRLLCPVSRSLFVVEASMLRQQRIKMKEEEMEEKENRNLEEEVCLRWASDSIGELVPL